MSALQITLGGGTNWMALVIPGAIAGVSTLIGIALTNWSLARHRKADREHEVKERRRVEDAEAALRKRDRGLAGLSLATHLESYTLHCMAVVTSVRGATWIDPNHTDPNYPGPQWLEAFGPWPELVDWKLVGLETAVAAEAFSRRAELARDGAADDHNTLDDNYAAVAEVAATLGLDAWKMAAKVRFDLGLDPFVWVDGWDGVATLEEYRDRRQLFQRARAEAAAELFGEASAATDEPPKAV